MGKGEGKGLMTRGVKVRFYGTRKKLSFQPAF